MDIKTLQEFLTLTKGQEYLIAVGSIVLFTLFWLLLDKDDTKDRKRNQ